MSLLISRPVDQSDFQENIEQRSQYFFEKMYKDLVFEIFSYLAVSELNSCSKVCKNWKLIFSDSDLWKKVIYENKAFGFTKWERFFGIGEIDSKSRAEDFLSLPSNILEMVKAPCPFFKKRSIMQTHFLLKIPKFIDNKPLNIILIGELFKKYLGNKENGYKFFDKYVFDQYEHIQIGYSHWLLITKESLPNSTLENFSEQTYRISQIANGHYQIPDLLEGLVYSFIRHFQKKIKGIEEVSPLHIRCKNAFKDCPIKIESQGKNLETLSVFSTPDKGKGLGVIVFRKI